MKNLKFISFLLLISASLIFVQCTHESVPGPAGEDGTDGINGVDGIDGVDGSAASCISCHSAEHREPIYDDYAMSSHGIGSSWARGTTQSCTQCHNNQGYIDYLSANYATEADGSTVDEAGEMIQSANPSGYTASNPIACTGCHYLHRSFDFENDGNDMALRNIDPVYLVINKTVSIDFTNEVDPLGLSNTCTTCHQPRNSYPVPSGIDPIEITSSRYGPHHGPQSTMLEGIMGSNIPGSTGYPGIGSATHNTGASCTTCHMGESAIEGEGGHAWGPTEESCVTCHPSGAPDEIAGYTVGMATLKTLLMETGILLENDRTEPGTYEASVAEACWNYKTLLEDKSNGIHNPAYSTALLLNSIEALGLNQ